MRNLTIATGILALAVGATAAALAEAPRLGKPISQADLAEWDINILPDGTNLPPGSGKAADGAKIFAEKCALCHGDNGKGGRAARLIGGPPKASLDGGKTIANYWPYATTLFDFIRRAMPFTQPRSLSDQEVYALVAYVLAENKLIGEAEEMNATTLPKVRMPNRTISWSNSPIGFDEHDFSGTRSFQVESDGVPKPLISSSAPRCAIVRRARPAAISAAAPTRLN